MQLPTKLLSALLIVSWAAACSSGSDEGDGSEEPTESTLDASSTPSPDAMAALGTVGSPCASPSDCSDPPDADCFTDEGARFGVVYPGGYCSKSCRAEEGEDQPDCGTGVCVTQGSSGGGGGVSQTFCAKPCDGPSDCRVDEGYKCHALPFDLGGYCGL